MHTGGEGELAAWEIVHNADDIRRWLSVVLELAEPADLTATAADLPALRKLRAAITHAAYGLAAGDPVRPADIAVINAAAAEPPLIPALSPDGALTFVAPTARAALSTLARDAIDLFSGPLANRIRVCAADNCGLLFVDASRPGRRRWCSMERCGNLAKVRKYRDS
ncbi:hypothetical protein GCM10011591_07750 [Nocardia camponoti]|uniref:Zinc finger CGNR domain-containing protein n=1 Tax=Nocardia camponoti TaxID=1616106 RepID=A0A917QA03_9NOCA|nr:hypothetical protein GCM10011591_07750 [Nocardia camponoti]